MLRRCSPKRFAAPPNELHLRLSGNGETLMAIDPSRAQLRGARAMLDWSIADLSKAAHVSVSSIQRAEHKGQPVSHDIVSAIVGTLHNEGVSFLTDDGQGAGIRCQGA